MNSKNIYLLSLLLALIFIYSCGSDSPSTPTTPSGTVLYSRDSVSVWLPPASHTSGHDSLYFSTQQTGGVQVTWTLQSNIDTAYGKPSWGFYTNASPSIPLLNITGPIDHTESTNLNFAPGTTYFSFGVNLSVVNNTIPYYVRVKNIVIRKL